MAQQSISMHFKFNKPLATVFEELSDHEQFGKLCGINMKRVRDGSDTPNGLGSVRKINIGPLPPFEETITGFKENSFIEYKITKGSPIKNHVGTLEFRESGQGCELDYVIKLESKIPFTTSLIKNVLKQGISKGIGQYANA
ncbi:hypothetical protein A3742_11740 [Oleiphilus sp. HI0071]|uniref:SRPBCC family protein n=1 Tax=unclassified Oleiphilus TaxID=2631174 RepID=UPI0007C402BE|nr:MULTISPECIES: SRPBCC family protein [unclassified Oleiphilus]KZY61257.1 hypothetical protein A3737_15445 [Oleiphilus sp. HI0065]KZY81468.1 hypothetical protein A3742_11740 [Oleiphilus sp. HI0071]KZY91662.1 hypothetical protein A3744_14970 [Oleiphilus sp. HI0073]KZZ49296.1 hypothetical protein A3758_31590 [Oleiphilus sp. HI0118]KZZ61855.1 hypothetical protein A3760_00155 [Oleiphilus sp. HI0122]KZZ65972.1 hypothetical protein A3765_05450 [Oleiphilus sp. HI0130]KZZ78237.1 hypothetical protei